MYQSRSQLPLCNPISSNPPSGTSESSRRYDLPKLSQSSLLHQDAPLRYGLQTPPEDLMGTTYQQPQYASYNGRQNVPYQGSGQQTNLHDYATVNQHSRATSAICQPSIAPGPFHSNKMDASVTYAAYSRPVSPPKVAVHDAQAQPKASTQTSNDHILSNLQIPRTISPNGGSLAEFAAQITCLFWFETTDTLKDAENVTPNSVVPKLKADALPTTGFRKWVVTTLTTTQVSRNVILLALLFIYRLKNINPGVKGRCGSEYRLLTVALMLGNKFLDDNTYTNKTWAEVSGISVTEIHVMEVEFLSNMRYTLLASEEQWAEWQKKLGKFWTYLDLASKPRTVQYSPQGIQILQPNMPTPPLGLQSSAATNSHLNVNGALNSTYSFPDLHHSISKKRSFEGDLEEPAAKRISRPQTTGPPPHPHNGETNRQDMQPVRHDSVRLPAPNLTVSTTLPAAHGYNGASILLQNAPVLPPLNSRAMSSVYPASTQSWGSNGPLLTPTGVLPPPQSTGYATPTRRHSPHTAQALMSLGSSPISAHFPQNTGHISPSIFLQQRSSPYRPVRHVETLLYPPPSASLHDYAANVDHMQYQPLGRRNEYRPGVLPHYSHSSSYDGTPLRQPNFAPKSQLGYAQQP